MVVLNTSEVPDQPPDRVGAGRRRLGQQVDVESLDGIARQGRDPAVELEEQRSYVHVVSSPQNPGLRPRFHPARRQQLIEGVDEVAVGQ